MTSQGDKTGFDRVSATLALDANVNAVNQVSAGRARALGKLGIRTVRDLVTHYPRRYTDLSRIARISEARIGDMCTIKAQVHEVKLKKPRPRLPLVEITLVDGTGTLIVTAFRQPWLADQLKPGDVVMIAGKVEFNYGFKRMTNPDLEKLEGAGEDVRGVIKPTHPTTSALPVGMMRRLVRNALSEIEGLVDPLPLALRAKYRLMSRYNALRCIHFPHTMDEQRQARRRLAYEELLLLELMLLQEGASRSAGLEPTSHVVDGPCASALAEAVPFELSDEQAQARDEILAKLAAPKAANHLLLGDVGTGKTIVAAFALAAAADTASQAMFMAPTEILVHQHAKSLGPLLAEAGIAYDVLTGSTAPDERAAILERAASGACTVLFGTHALLEDDVVLARCSLVVIDEQQRFGVEQRQALLAKGACPDALFLTATPIPRSLAMALYGNLTLSYITKRPHGAPPRVTRVHNRDERGLAYDAARAALARGEQVYVICPLVGERNPDDGEGGGEGPDGGRDAASGSDPSAGAGSHPAAGASSGPAAGAGSHPAAGAASGSGPASSVGAAFDAYGRRGAAGANRKSPSAEEDDYEFGSIVIEDESDMTGLDAHAAEAQAAFLQAKVFPDYKVGLVHGRLPAAEKQAAMERFAAAETQVLVATTVIEVGVDVPNATVLIVEDADRFGLAQLHQLRGRVGRGTLPSEVHLISNTRQETALRRLAVMETTDDGFELARYDLSLRREGDILGNRQHGASMLKLVNVVRDAAIVEAARADAEDILADDPDLSSPAYQPLAREARVVYRSADAPTGG